MRRTSRRVTLLFGLWMVSFSAALAMRPTEARLDAAPQANGRLASNSIIDIVPHRNTVWLGTGSGLNQIYLDGSGTAWSGQPSGLGRGGVVALVVSDSVIWAATGYYEKTDFGYLPAGGGVGRSRDGGETWDWEPQPVDPRTITNYKPTTTNIQNVTYDIAVTDSAVWIVSWGGGIRRMKHGATAWEVKTPDGLPFSAIDHLSHLGFSAVVANNTLFIGTAAGIFRSSDEGVSWRQSAHQLGAPSISGNFITAMGVQQAIDRQVVWAATWKAQGAYEYYGIARSHDNGLSWQMMLSDSTVLNDGAYFVDRYGNLKVHNFGFRGGEIYAAADNGVWYSLDDGLTWGGLIERMDDATTGESLSGIDFFAAATTGDSLWLGTDDGLAVGWFDAAQGQYRWRIHRAYQPPEVNQEPAIYAYPSPFSPMRGHITRFQFNLTAPADVWINIWNFAMEPVIEIGPVHLPGGGVGSEAGYGAVKWDGRDKSGRWVANGVYFYRVKRAGVESWGKVMVLN